jgi:tRNA/tmRNA/rRNA uracil-C5-methylase (TrmA/RlmC/RlmD family)
MARQKVKREPEYLEDVEIIDAGAEGMSVAKPEGRVVFIPFGVPGDVVDIEVYKRKKNFFEGNTRLTCRGNCYLVLQPCTRKHGSTHLCRHL